MGGGNYTWVTIAMRKIGPLWFNVGRYGAAMLVLVAVFLALGRARDAIRESGERMQLAVIGLFRPG